MKKKGDIISTQKGEIKIIKLLGEGGQGFVFKVKFNGKEKALKVYKKVMSPQFSATIIKLTERKNLGKAFIWPEYAFLDNNLLCYIMDLRPDNFIDLNTLTSGKDLGFHYNIRITACLNIINAFRNLHSMGYAFLDINYGGFFVDPNTGSVLIADCDNIVENGINLINMFGFPGAVAPELVIARSKFGTHLISKKVVPDKYTDYHSLAVLIHLILTHQDPLQGPKYLTTDGQEDELELETYGTNPVYIMDPINFSNRANTKYHKNFLSIWNELPLYMQEIFQKAFSKDCLFVGSPKGDYSNRQYRVNEREWMDVLFRFRTNLVVCPRCSYDIFIKQRALICDNCKNKINVLFAAHIKNKYFIPIHGMTVLAKGQVMEANLVDDSTSDYLKVVSIKDKELGIKNVSPDEILIKNKEGKKLYLKPQESILLIEGLKFIFNNSYEVEIFSYK